MKPCLAMSVGLVRWCKCRVIVGDHSLEDRTHKKRIFQASNYKSKLSISSERVGNISDSECFLQFALVKFGMSSEDPRLLRTSANTSSEPGLWVMERVKLFMAEISSICLAQAHSTGSLPLPASSTCWEAILSVLTAI